MAKAIADENVPGLYVASETVAAEIRVGSWKFQKLADGGVFASDWRGNAESECMVGHLMFTPADAAALAGLLKVKV